VARRIVAQSCAGWPSDVPRAVRVRRIRIAATGERSRDAAAIRHLEHLLSADRWRAWLRYGALCGGNAIGAGGETLAGAQRRLPVVGGGTGVWSFLHIDDAAHAAVVAAEGGPQGIYNIVDDEPAAVRVWLPYLARSIGAKSPLRLPAWLLRPMLGEHATSMMTRVRGA
jgi:hypothetical protein